MSRRDQHELRAADVAKANQLAEHLTRTAQFASAPKSALCMKDANDLHNLIAAAAKDTRELCSKLRVHPAVLSDDDSWLVTNEVRDALLKYRDTLNDLEDRSRLIYARALALHVAPGASLTKIAERLDQIEKTYDELLAETKLAPPASSVIELPKT